MTGRVYGEQVPGLTIDGRAVLAGVVDERQVRAAAGLTMVLGAVAFGYAFLAKEFTPIKLVTVLFLAEFVLRTALGLRFAPLGRAAGLLVRRGEPEWVSAAPKRFAWSLGVAMSAAMALITNANVRGLLPLTICLVCLTLMWMESVLGLCLGCEAYRVLVGRGWLAVAESYEICAHGACARPADAVAHDERRRAADTEVIGPVSGARG
jgi:hypothetical protein